MPARKHSGAGENPHAHHQHFLLSAAARDMPLQRVFGMKEQTAYNWFRRARWPRSGGRIPVCPHCGCEGAYELGKFPDRVNRVFRCRQYECRDEFTVTSGTILADRKLPFRTLLAALVLTAQSVKGKAALELSRELGISYKTAFVLLTKLREAIAAERETLRLSGEVEVDVLYIGGHVRPANRVEDRVDRRLPENQNRKRPRQAVMGMRERNGRSVMRVVPGETEEAAMAMARRYLARGTIIAADQASAYQILQVRHELRVNNHSEVYSASREKTTNHVESLFSRVRRSEAGVHHHISGNYLDLYAADLAFREDMRRLGMKALTGTLGVLALVHPHSRLVRGYWKRHLIGRKTEMLGLARDLAVEAARPRARV
jgi:transposase-like protein